MNRNSIESLVDSPALQPIDRQFGRFVERLAGGNDPWLRIAAALLSRSRGEGHTCLELPRLASADFVAELLDQALPGALPEVRQWTDELRKSPVVGEPGQFRPLILDRKGRLYLQRYWAYEDALAQAILERAGRPPEPIDERLLQNALNRFFPNHRAAAPDQQALALALAARRALAVVSGGPGTGKTRTVAMLLALLLEQAGPNRCRIALCAPTGKAATRLQESIQRLKPGLACAEELKGRLPTEAFTVHRLLGIMSDTGRPRYHAEHCLPFELVVVDEASMVDLALMAKLFAALAPAARLVLLGDKDQLASVEAGAVLGDLCQDSPGSSPLRNCIARLEKNYRFGPNHGFLSFSQAVNAGDADRALEVVRANRSQTLSAAPVPAPAQLRQALTDWVRSAFREAATASEPGAALEALSRVRILVALRQGPYGVQNMNAMVEQILGDAGWLQLAERWYHRRPIIITRNDYHLNLFNGDVGVLWSDGDSSRAWFQSVDGGLRCFAPARLPAHETVFAMTVHKSQGSEFDRVLFILPDQLSPVLTRELVYTGVTRASGRMELWFSEPVLRAAVARKAERPSGLREALWGEPGPVAPAAKPLQLELMLG